MSARRAPFRHRLEAATSPARDSHAFEFPLSFRQSNMNLHHRLGAVSLGATLVLLAACGGGGGDSEPQPNTATPTSNPSSSGSGGSTTPPPVSQTPPAALFTEVTRETALIYGREILREMKIGLSDGKNVPTVFDRMSTMLSVGSTAGECRTGHTGTINLTVVNPSGGAILDKYDSAIRSFNNCNFSTSFYYLSGSIGSFVAAFSGSLAAGSSWSGEVHDSYSNYFSKALGDRSATSAHGSVHYIAAIDDSAGRTSASSHYLNYTAKTFGAASTNGVFGLALYEYRYGDYLVKYTSDPAGGTVALDGSYTYAEPTDVTFVPIEFHYATDTPFRFELVDGQDAIQPGAGKAKLLVVTTGANGTRLGSTFEMVYLDATGARLHVDLDNNGTVDVSYDLTWAELQ
jgi:hypothetical protein